MLDLNKDVKYIKGVGPARAELLNSIGIFFLYDLITIMQNFMLFTLSFALRPLTKNGSIPAIAPFLRVFTILFSYI